MMYLVGGGRYDVLTLQILTPFLPEMQMLFLLMLKGNSRAQAMLVMVSTVASLNTSLMLSAWSVGFPAIRKLTQYNSL